jgi:AcrR family transcriptional regulator
MSEKVNSSPSSVASGDRGDITRHKLLLAAIDVFGRHGFDGTSTRHLANAAGVNLQAIPYYFGGKEGLYIAAAEHIANVIAAHVSDLRESIRDRLTCVEHHTAPVTTAEAQKLLGDIIEIMAMLFVSRESETWARFLIREQMEPTDAFQRVYGGVMQPTLEVTSRLVGIILRKDPNSEHVRLRTLALLGGVMVFRIAHAATLAQLGWRELGAREAAIIRGHARELATSLVPSGAAS